MRVSSEDAESPVRRSPSRHVAVLMKEGLAHEYDCLLQMMVPVWAQENQSSRTNGCPTVR